MAIRFNCSNCNAKYAVDEKLGGKQAKCKTCQHPMLIPTVSAVPAQQSTGKASAASNHALEPRESASPAAAARVDRSSVAAELVSSPVARPSAAGRPAAGVIPVAETILPTSPGEALVPSLTQDELMLAITGEIQRVPTTLSYRIAAVSVAGLMILLPLIYIGLIGLAMAGVWWYAIHGTAIFQNGPRASGRGGFILLLLYVGPIVVGVTTVLFMIKPLFARPARHERRRSLTRKAEPKLFAFVDKLCESVHAPKPRRIDVDCEVNASASFRRGMLSMLFSGDLVLTIGMPLVAGLSARQLGGVLAHEFGHFSQGFGMRVSYVVRSISHWFARVVYERDRWDDWLANTARTVDFRIGIVLHFARLLIWLTRRILWCLMMVGNILSCYLLRQMEFDADLHEIRFSGSDNFRKTSMQLRRLGIAYQQGLADQQGFFMDGKLGNDLPKLVQLNRDAQDSEMIKKIFAGVMEEKTEWLTTHPVDKDRVARAQAAKEPGVFQLEAPASALFDHYPQICQGVTQDMFRAVFGAELKPTMLVPVDQLVSHKAAAREANLALRRMFGNHFSIPRHMVFPSSPTIPESSRTSVAKLRQARETMVELLPQYAARSKQFDEIDSKWLLCHQVYLLLDVGVKLNQADFNVPVDSPAAAMRAAEKYRSELAMMNDDLKSLEGAFEQRVAAAGELLLVPAMNAKLAGEAAQLHNQMQRVSQTLPEIHLAYADTVKVRNQLASAALTLRAVGGQELAAETVSRIMSKVEQIGVALHAMSKRLHTASFPFEHADGQISLTRYMLPKLPPKDDVGEVLGAAERFVENYHYVYFRSIGTLANICQQVELALGLEPQIEPPAEPTEEAVADGAA